MAIGRSWRRIKVLQATGQAANEAAAQASPGQVHPRGMGAAFANIMTEAMAPVVEAMAELRGGPLPGSDAAVVDGSAWARPVADGAAALRARDEAFDVALLASFAGQVFSAVAAVWEGADAGSVRPVLSDTMWEPLATVSGRRSSRRRRSDGLVKQLVTPELTGLHAGAWYDSAMVVMHVRLDFGKQRPPADTAARWDEDWLFQRSARPGGEPMIRPPACPSCGAPTSVDQAGQCTHCRELVPFLTTGWLVTGIFSHHPRHAMVREQWRANPELIQKMSPAMARFLSDDQVAAWRASSPPGSTP
jgi:hypothetical protein